MLRESFVVLPRVRQARESLFWSQGLHCWDDFLSSSSVRGVSSAKKIFFDSRLREAKLRLRDNDFSFFAGSIPFSEQWRLYDEFRDNVLYLDIETDGYYGGITVIGISDGVSVKTFVRGFNLERSLVLKELKKCSLLVTFNGACFDLPVIKRFFNFSFPVPHIDLRFVCQKLGFSGGLKAIEKELGITRRAEVDGLAGADAVYLWEMWRSTGERDFLDRLVMYNEEDILNLRILADRLVPLLWSKVRGRKKE